MKLNTSMIRTVLMVVVVMIMLFTVIADTAGEVGHAAGNLSDTNASGTEVGVREGDNPSEVFPLTSFFKRKGVLLLAFLAGIIIVVITTLIPRGKGK